MLINNYAGRSAVGSDVLRKELRPGWNFVNSGYVNYDCGNLLKDWSLRLEKFNFISEWFDDGRPKTIDNGGTFSVSPFYSVVNANGIDDTVIPLPPGLWAVTWNDDNPSDPTTFSIINNFAPTMVSVTEREDLGNPGTGGQGIVRVYDIQPLHLVDPSPPEGYTTSVNLTLRMDNANSSPRFSGLAIYGPGDFTPASPTTVDTSDRWALSKVWKDRLGYGCGVVRTLDSSAVSASGFGSSVEYEECAQTADFTYGRFNGKWEHRVFPSEARPWDHTVSPYIYSHHFGSAYAATLSVAISDYGTPTQIRKTDWATGQTIGTNVTLPVSTITISDAATAPIVVGQRLKVGNELMRVLAVNGTAITVERGTCFTTSAQHLTVPASIEVQYRWAVRQSPITVSGVSGTSVVTVTTSAPHGYLAGDLVFFNGISGLQSPCIVDTVPLTTSFTVKSGIIFGVSSIDGTSGVITTYHPHGLIADDWVNIVAPNGQAFVEGVHQVATVPSTSSLTLAGVTPSGSFGSYAYVAKSNVWTGSFTSGTVQKSNITLGSWFECPFSAQHLFRSGEMVNVVGSWPGFTMQNGQQPYENWAGAGQSINVTNLLIYATGPDSFVGSMSGERYPYFYQTLDSTYTLNGTNQGFEQTYPSSVGFPYAVNAKNIGKIKGCNIQINLPHAFSDSAVIAVARDIRDNFPSGRVVYVENGNEPWNNQISVYPYETTTSQLLYPGEFYLAWNVVRTQQIKDLFVAAFNEDGRNRGSEIKSLINCHRYNGGNMIQNSLDYGRQHNALTDMIQVAPYVAFNDDSAQIPIMAKYHWQCDDDQAIDLWIHNLYYNTNGSGAAVLSARKNDIDTYNSVNGTNVLLGGYEGDVKNVSVITSMDVVPINDSATQILVTTLSGLPDLSYLVAGTPLKIENEWMTYESCNTSTNVINVLRGQYGTTASAHSSGILRTAYLERTIDLIYNPNYRIAQLDFYALVQKNGFTEFNSFFFSGGKADIGSWFGAYHAQQQDHGCGDGTDGKTDNRRCLAVPGKTYSKSATTSQEVYDNGTGRNVSTRGQAFLDWMRQVSSTIKRWRLRTSAGMLRLIVGLPPQPPVMGLIGRWKASLGAYHSSDDSEPCTDGQSVHHWKDQSGVVDPVNVIQITSGNQPTYIASSINSKPAIRFTKSNTSSLDSTVGITHISSGDYWIAVVYRTGTLAGLWHTIFSIGGIDANLLFHPAGTLAISTIDGTHVFEASLADSTAYLSEFCRVDGFIKLYHAGIGETTILDGNSFPDMGEVRAQTVSIGSDFTPYYTADMDVAEILVYDHTFDPTIHKTPLEHYINSEYGVVNIPTMATLSGPSNGQQDVASSDFTIALNYPANKVYSFDISYTDTGGTITSTPVVISIGGSIGTFTVTPSTAVEKSISISTESGGPGFSIVGSPHTYTADVTGSFTVAPTTIPTGHNGPILLKLTGTATSWTDGSSISISNTGSSATVNYWIQDSSTSAVLFVTTGSGEGSFKITIDGVESGSITVSNPTVGTTYHITPTGGATTPHDGITTGKEWGIADLFTIIGTGASQNFQPGPAVTSLQAGDTLSFAAGDYHIVGLDFDGVDTDSPTYVTLVNRAAGNPLIGPQRTGTLMAPITFKSVDGGIANIIVDNVCNQVVFGNFAPGTEHGHICFIGFKVVMSPIDGIYHNGQRSAFLISSYYPTGGYCEIGFNEVVGMDRHYPGNHVGISSEGHQDAYDILDAPRCEGNWFHHNDVHGLISTPNQAQGLITTNGSTTVTGDTNTLFNWNNDPVTNDFWIVPGAQITIGGTSGTVYTIVTVPSQHSLTVDSGIPTGSSQTMFRYVASGWNPLNNTGFQFYLTSNTIVEDNYVHDCNDGFFDKSNGHNVILRRNWLTDNLPGGNYNGQNEFGIERDIIYNNVIDGMVRIYSPCNKVDIYNNLIRNTADYIFSGVNARPAFVNTQTRENYTLGTVTTSGTAVIGDSATKFPTGQLDDDLEMLVGHWIRFTSDSTYTPHQIVSIEDRHHLTLGDAPPNGSGPYAMAVYYSTHTRMYNNIIITGGVNLTAYIHQWSNYNDVFGAKNLGPIEILDYNVYDAHPTYTFDYGRNQADYSLTQIQGLSSPGPYETHSTYDSLGESHIVDSSYVVQGGYAIAGSDGGSVGPRTTTDALGRTVATADIINASRYGPSAR